MFSLSGVLVVLTTGVLIFCFIDPGRSHSPSISYNPSSNTVTNYDQYQTLETWTCVLSVKASSLNILRQQCRQARAARFLLIPNIAVTALLACCLAWRQRVFNLHQDDVPDKVEIDALEKRTGFVTRPSEQTIVELDTGSAKEVAGGQITELPQAAAELPGPKMTYNGAEYFAGTAIPSATVHSGWPLDRVILWLSVNNFSIEWQELFRYLNLDEGLFLDLGRDDANKKDANAMYHKILPQLAQQYRKSGVRWDRQKARDESRRLQRLIRSILED
ncbi:hypothetical protein EJ05DRAFT_166268 [Pseudovirgaria hyperparasitica]|uniref:Uncharacterized protein n=1 Tax=Pseudovirgaria hyperparasitica TaxID=470096 RepID=A0A6A6VWK6_9PEZI|nr:uncharacterized protein EJ05DRAFT_166268 [Pseudovirgaria hyperparasitica]KAF2753621.1 hypothetical protein EJ05DRAFT_166268 [Pseudovirgaria hyperparasitica]